ncbi:MAG TPA: Lrp/AsnC family transcriptional regulator [Coriobacteriia bacterium]|nr:Lrp/AsnC family transcriptional regulator [Coriobacteriia bacterium]
MDKTDIKLLRALAFDGRRAFSDLAADVDLSAPSTADRVRRLERVGAIKGYRAEIDPSVFNFDLVAFVSVTLDDPAARDGYLSALVTLPEVLECHHVAGDDDYVLKVRTRGTAGLEELVSSKLKGIAGVSRTKTTVVLSTPVERAFVPEAE